MKYNISCYKRNLNVILSQLKCNLNKRTEKRCDSSTDFNGYHEFYFSAWLYLNLSLIHQLKSVKVQFYFTKLEKKIGSFEINTRTASISSFSKHLCICCCCCIFFRNIIFLHWNGPAQNATVKKNCTTSISFLVQSMPYPSVDYGKHFGCQVSYISYFHLQRLA